MKPPDRLIAHPAPICVSHGTGVGPDQSLGWQQVPSSPTHGSIDRALLGRGPQFALATTASRHVDTASGCREGWTKKHAQKRGPRPHLRILVR